MAKFAVIQNAPGQLRFDCPGCKCSHYINQQWEFNGNMDRPTVSPSILVQWPYFKEIIDGVGVKGTEENRVCHSFIKDGMIQFLSDCTHELKSQTVELPEL